MTTPGFSGLTRAELLELAAAAGIRGRSRMRKAELIEALATREPAQLAESFAAHLGLPPADRVAAARRRAALGERLAALVDPGRRCHWVSGEGHVCGLPVVAGEDRCGLHGGCDIFDRAVPLLGRLGADTWPTLLRHLWLATYDVDPIGLDPVVAEFAWYLANLLYFDYFRIRVEGAEHIPADGPAVLVSNHGGAALPYDGFMLSMAVCNEMARPRRLRVAATEIFNLLPWASHLFRKAGGVYAARADAEYVLGRGHLLGVFPEGEKGFMKPVWEAYRVQRFGRGGFVELAERAGAPIVPVAILGSEEVHPALFVSTRLARLVRLVFPEQRVEQMAVFLNPVPLPVRWHIRFLPALPAGAGGDPDPLDVLERTEVIRGRIQRNLDDMISQRRSLF